MRAWLLAFILGMSGTVYARPSFLVIQQNAPPVHDTDPNLSIAPYLAEALAQTGKFDATPSDSVLPTPKAPAAKSGRSGDVGPASPSLLSLLSRSKLEFALVIQAVKSSESVATSAVIYRANGQIVWSEAKNYSIQIGGRPDWTMAAIATARSIALIIASGPFKDTKVTRATEDDPKARLPGPSPPKEAVKEDTNSSRLGMQALDEGRALDAVGLLREAVDQSPIQPELRAALARAYFLANMPENALNECRRARDLMPDSSPIEETYGELLRHVGELEQAETVLKAVIARTPMSLTALLALGDLYLTSQQYDQAIAQYREAAKAAPTNPEPVARLARGLALVGQYEQSTAAFEQAKKLGLRSDSKAQRERYITICNFLDRAIGKLAQELQSIRQAAKEDKPDVEVLKARVAAVSLRANALGGYVETMEKPAAHSGSSQRYTLVTQLLAQAALALAKHVDTGNADALEDAMVYSSDALRTLKSAHDAFQDELAKN